MDPNCEESLFALAPRRLGRSEVATALADANPKIVLEAARAIHDEPVPAALPQLAAFITKPTQSEPLLRRVINANFRLGTPDSAAYLARFAARADAREKSRIEAMDALAAWPKPANLDRVLNIYRPLPPRDSVAAANAMKPLLAPLLSSPSDSVRVSAIQVLDQLSLTGFSEMLFGLVTNETSKPTVRVAALKVFAKSDDTRLAPAVRAATSSMNSELRAEGLKQLTHLSPDDAVPIVSAARTDALLREQQVALTTLGSLENDPAATLLAQWLDRLLAGNVAKELQLDLLEAAAKRPTPALQSKLKQFEGARGTNDSLASFREALFGGDAAAGRKMFFERVDASCLRCHKIGWEGGDVGPNLTGIGKKQTREYLLESIVSPNAKIAVGFESVTLIMKSGASHAGAVKQETAEWLELNSPEDGFLQLAKNKIAERQRGLSGMPDGFGQTLSKRDLRDLVEILVNLK